MSLAVMYGVCNPCTACNPVICGGTIFFNVTASPCGFKSGDIITMTITDAQGNSWSTTHPEVGGGSGGQPCGGAIVDVIINIGPVTESQLPLVATASAGCYSPNSEIINGCENVFIQVGALQTEECHNCNVFFTEILFGEVIDVPAGYCAFQESVFPPP
jgi:hypothetical protein